MHTSSCCFLALVRKQFPTAEWRGYLLPFEFKRFTSMPFLSSTLTPLNMIHLLLDKVMSHHHHFQRMSSSMINKQTYRRKKTTHQKLIIKIGRETTFLYYVNTKAFVQLLLRDIVVYQGLFHLFLLYIVVSFSSLFSSRLFFYSIFLFFSIMILKYVVFSGHPHIANKWTS